MTKYSNMTRAEAAKLKNDNGKNLNGGKYENPNIPMYPLGDAIKMVGIIAMFVLIATSM